MPCVTAGKDGRAHFDVDGRLVGNWFHESQPVSEGNAKGAAPLGILLVQMLDDRRIRVELVPGAAAVATAFSVVSQVYLREPPCPSGCRAGTADGGRD